MRGAANCRISNKKKTATLASTSWLVTPRKLGNERAEKPVRGKRAISLIGLLLRLTRFHHGRDHGSMPGQGRVKLHWVLSPQMAYTLVMSGEDSYSFSPLVSVRGTICCLGWSSLTSGVFSRKLAKPHLGGGHHQYLNAP